MDVKRLSGTYKVTYLDEGHIPAIYELSKGNPLFYKYCPPFVTEAGILEDMQALPPGVSADNKFYVGFWQEGQLLAVLDLLLDYPEQRMAWIGLFMVDAGFQKQGIGSAVVDGILDCLREEGCTQVRLAFAKGNVQSEHFWQKNGFRLTGEEKVLDHYTAVKMVRDCGAQSVSGMQSVSGAKSAGEVSVLPVFDNHDSRIRYYDIMMERSLEDFPGELPAYGLPAGYHFEFYKTGDMDAWIAIEKSAKELANEDQGVQVWRRYFSDYEAELGARMIFVVNEKGEKVATASAYFDVIDGDIAGDGWLHWVAVHRDYQGRGLSKPLVNKALATLKDLGYKKAIIPTQTTSWVACKVYLDFGFMPVPGNAVKSKMGWRILKRLTDHPALSDFESASDDEVLLKLNLKDMSYQPEISEISDFIGIDLFENFYKYMLETYKPVCRLEFSRDSWFPGWNLKFRKAGKALCAVYPYQQFFKILVVVGQKERAQVESVLPQMSKEMQAIYETTKEGNGQRWLMIDVEENNELYRDVLQLIQIRRTAKW